MPVKIGGVLGVLLGLVLGPGVAQACEVGQVLQPGDACELTVKWGTDHWIVAEFSDEAAHSVEIAHLEGNCQVNLYGPIETEEILIGPDQALVSRALEGEYHMFTRAIVVAREDCRFRISVN